MFGATLLEVCLLIASVSAVTALAGGDPPPFAKDKEYGTIAPQFVDPITKLPRRRNCGTRSHGPPVARGTRALSQQRPYPLTGLVIPVNFIILETQNSGVVTDQQIDLQIAKLNAGFAGSEENCAVTPSNTTIAFVRGFVRRERVTGEEFSGCHDRSEQIVGKYTTETQRQTAINIFTCEPWHLGFVTSLPDPETCSPDDRSNAYSAVFLNYHCMPNGGYQGYNEGDTAVHEVGHYLGLHHTFFGGCTSPGDGVDDTPYEASPAFGCQPSRDTCPSSGTDPIYNYMDYPEDHCLCTFTPLQGQRMRDTIVNCRPGLIP